MLTLGQELPQIHQLPPAQQSVAWIDRLAQAECPALTARRARRQELSGVTHDPIVWAEAHGANVRDVDGNLYVDMTAGFGACAIGHTHPKVIHAVQTQAQRLLHALGDVHPSTAKIELSERLQKLAPWAETRVIFGLSGSDAIEAALKTAALFTQKPGVLAFAGSYHGLAHGPLSACGYQEVFRAPFVQQLNPHVVFAPFPRTSTKDDPEYVVKESLAQLERTWERAGDTLGCILVEPILGRGGVIVPPRGFLKALASFAKEHGALLIVDEIFTGLGRTGALWRTLEEDCCPDLICVGKALGGGLPVSACLGDAKIMLAWGNPDHEAIHTGTFVGYPLGCAAALASLDVLETEKLPHRSQKNGLQWLARLKKTLATHASVREVRGVGLMIGIEFDRGERALTVMRKLLENGYITLTGGKKSEVLTLSPPLSIDTAILDHFANTLDVCLRETNS